MGQQEQGAKAQGDQAREEEQEKELLRQPQPPRRGRDEARHSPHQHRGVASSRGLSAPPGLPGVLKGGERERSGWGPRAGLRTPRRPLWDPPEVQGVWSESSRARAGAQRPRRGPGEGGCSAGARARRALQPAVRLVHGARALPRLPAPELSHAVCDALAGCAGAHAGPGPLAPEVSASGAVCNGSPRGCSTSTAPRARARLVETARGPAIRTRPQLCSAQLRLPRFRGTRGLQTLAQAKGCPRSACEACSWPRSVPDWEAAAAPKSADSGAATREGAGLPLRSPVPGPAAPLAAQPPQPQLQTGRRRSSSHCDSAAAPPPAGHALRPRPHARPAPRPSARRVAPV